MSELDDAFARLLGHQPTDKDRQDLYRVRDALKLKSTDAVWLLLMALQHYETLYEKFPARIAEAARDVTKSARATAEAQAKAAHAETEKALMETVRQTSVVSMKRSKGVQLCKWICGAAVVICLSLVGVFAWGYTRGARAGIADGKEEVRKQFALAAAASAWASSDEGQLAYGLAKVGSLRELATCSGRGLARKGNACFAKFDRSAPFSWRLPDEAGRGR